MSSNERGRFNPDAVKAAQEQAQTKADADADAAEALAKLKAQQDAQGKLSDIQANAFEAFNETKTVIFPKDFEQDQFIRFETSRIGGGIGVARTDKRFVATGSSCTLPMPAGVNVTYEQGWDQEGQGLLGTGVQAAMDAFRGRLGGTLGKLQADIGGDTKAGASALGGVGNLLETAVGSAVAPGASQAATGAAAFKNTYLVYGGPGFRAFSYTFNLKPLSQRETPEVREVIQFFKERSAPIAILTGPARVYALPEMFTITYCAGAQGAENEYINKVATSALTSINVVYGGDKYSVFNDLAPVEYTLTLNFKEVVLLSREDILDGY